MSKTDQHQQLRWLQRSLTNSNITRREFIGRAVALGMTTALASSLAGRAARAATPKKGGEMTLAMKHGETSDTIDPASLINGYQWALAYAMRDTLTEVTAGGKLVPSLAESWEAHSAARHRPAASSISCLTPTSAVCPLAGMSPAAPRST